MTILLWKILDHRVVEPCVGPALWLVGLTAAFILLPDGSGLETAAVFYGLIVAVILVCRCIAALTAQRRSSG